MSMAGACVTGLIYGKIKGFYGPKIACRQLIENKS